MTRLFLMRHAEQQLGPGDDPDQPFSAGDRPLSDVGRREAKAAAAALADEPIDAAYASPLTRARETAGIVADPHDLDVVVDDRLVELPFVAADVLDYDRVMDGIRSLARGLEDGGDPVMAHGKPFSIVRDRILQVVGEVVDRHACPLVVAHGGVNRLVLTHALGRPWHEMFEIGQDHACINVLEGEGGALEVVRVNGRADAEGG